MFTSIGCDESASSWHAWRLLLSLINFLSAKDSQSLSAYVRVQQHNSGEENMGPIQCKDVILPV